MSAYNKNRMKTPSALNFKETSQNLNSTTIGSQGGPIGVLKPNKSSGAFNAGISHFDQSSNNNRANLRSGLYNKMSALSYSQIIEGSQVH